jgi:hypothetical protein
MTNWRLGSPRVLHWGIEQIPAILPLGTAKTSAVDEASHPPRAYSHNLGPRLPSLAMQQVGSYLGYTGRAADAVEMTAPSQTFLSRPKSAGFNTDPPASRRVRC